MINQIYQLINQNLLMYIMKKILNDKDKIVVRPNYMALCHADQRYYTKGKENPKILAKKLPMHLL